MENGGQDMLDELYKEHIIPDTKHLPNMDITLGIKKNSSSEETQSKYDSLFSNPNSCI